MEVDGSGGRGAGEEAAEERSDPLAAGEGAAESERANANEADEHSVGGAEGRGADVVE